MLRRKTLLDTRNRLPRVQVLGAYLGTVHNGMTTVQLEGVIQFFQTLGSGSIA